MSSRNLLSRGRRGFTLIELLVVIAIIALLISILLPAVGKMRKVGWMTVSRANLRSICTAASVYSNEQKGFYPMVTPHPSTAVSRGFATEYVPGTGTPLSLGNAWFCTWGFGGKDCRGTWLPGTGSMGGRLDLEAADRPLNSYLTDAAISAPPPGQPWAANSLERMADKMPVFRDPSDKLGHQSGGGGNPPAAGWPNPNAYDPTLGSVSCYMDVGTSYQMNIKWWDYLQSPPPNRIPLDPTKAWWTGNRMIRAADTFDPSRFAWVHDEYADIVVYNNNPNYVIKNGYGDPNRSIMGFIDGHVNYLPVYPGATHNGNYPGTSYSNDKYTFIFDAYR